MAKKKSRKFKSGEKPAGERAKTSAQEPTQNEPEGPFNYGGLPDIDFKKNLGCG